MVSDSSLLQLSDRLSTKKVSFGGMNFICEVLKPFPHKKEYGGTPPIGFTLIVRVSPKQKVTFFKPFLNLETSLINSLAVSAIQAQGKSSCKMSSSEASSSLSRMVFMGKSTKDLFSGMVISFGNRSKSTPSFALLSLATFIFTIRGCCKLSAFNLFNLKKPLLHPSSMI